jgi:serine/threonine-protein kinase
MVVANVLLPATPSRELEVVDELVEQLQSVLSDHYTIVREVGRGGMATVFLAEQKHPRRQVAVKVLDPHLATEIARERFLREVELASGLTHPHIVPIFAAGEAEGLLYFVMPYIEGPSLRVRLARERKLPVEEALAIAGEVGDALEYAHSRDIVHRDIKPENILLSDGHAVVADFGIARALCVSCDDHITIAGVPIGTPGYMSPEQAAGEEEIDPRADMYSLACVLYEMLTGQPPFRGPTIEAVMMARFRSPAPSLRGAGWTLSDTIDQAVQRAMQNNPDDRFGSVSEFLKVITPRPSGESLPDTLPVLPKPAPAEQSVAVLPLTNLSADPENQYFSDGITDDIITQLSKVQGIKVTSRTSIMQYKNTNKSLGQIGGELGVTNILEGSVRRAGNRVRVVAQLIDARTDKHLWADSYDRDLTDIFEIQGEIAEHIAGALQATLTPDEQRELDKKPTDNLEAYNLYLQGRFYWGKFTPSGIERGIEFFQQAAKLDPQYALAYAGIADSYLLMGATLVQLAPKEAFPKAKEAALKALELDDTLVEAHATLAAVHMWYDWDCEAAMREVERARQLAPELEKPMLIEAFCLAAMGRTEEAIELTRRAEQQCPIDVLIAGHVGLQLFWARRYDEAVAQLEKALEMEENFPPANYVMGWTHLAAGDYDQALKFASRASELSGHTSARRTQVGCVHAAMGQRAEAEEILRGLKKERGEQYVSAADIALLESYLDNADAAFEWLDRALQERSAWLSHLKVDPIWDRLSRDARFDVIVRRAGIP